MDKVTLRKPGTTGSTCLSRCLKDPATAILTCSQRCAALHKVFIHGIFYFIIKAAFLLLDWRGWVCCHGDELIAGIAENTKRYVDYSRHERRLHPAFPSWIFAQVHQRLKVSFVVCVVVTVETESTSQTCRSNTSWKISKNNHIFVAEFMFVLPNNTFFLFCFRNSRHILWVLTIFMYVFAWTIEFLCISPYFRLVVTRAVEPELKFRAPGIYIFWLRLRPLKVFGSSSRTIWSNKNKKKHCIILKKLACRTNYDCWMGTQISGSGSTI